MYKCRLLFRIAKQGELFSRRYGDTGDNGVILMFLDSETLSCYLQTGKFADSYLY